MTSKRATRQIHQRVFKGVFLLDRVFKHLAQQRRSDDSLERKWADVDAMETIHRLAREVNEEGRAALVGTSLEQAKEITQTTKRPRQ